MDEKQDLLELTLDEIKKEQKYLDSSTEPKWKQAMRVAEDCVNYRLKKPPIKKDVDYRNGKGITRYLCPTCQKSINGGLRRNGGHIIDYCNVCGQGIDWGDTHEK